MFRETQRDRNRLRIDCLGQDAGPGAMGEETVTPFFSWFETKSHSVAQSELECTVFLPQPPKCWDFSHAPLDLARGVSQEGMTML